MPPRHFTTTESRVSENLLKSQESSADSGGWNVYVRCRLPSSRWVAASPQIEDWKAVIPVGSRAAGEDVIEKLNGLYLGGARRLEVSFHPLSTAHSESWFGDSKVAIDLNTLRLIHMTLEKVTRHGSQFERLLMEREFYNPKFEFLFQSDLKVHAYYEQMLEQLLNKASVGEQLSHHWTNQALAPLVLGTVENMHLHVLLQYITVRRGSIARITDFATRNVAHAREIADMIYLSIVHVPEPVTTLEIRTRMARVWVIHDILHNQPPRSPYYQVFKPFIPRIADFFDSLSCSRLTKERCKRQLSMLKLDNEILT